ncbi:MAG: macro domain-containing protein [Bacteroidales bacterium]|nr:macro domain-containing protein [Candidatus Latescibacterota bacterium]
MFWNIDNERDERKTQFIENIKIRKCHDLLSPLSDKLLAWDHGEISPDEVISAALHAGKTGTTIISDFKKRPEVILAGIAMDENKYLTAIGDTGISVRQANVTDVFSDAIICPVPEDGSMRTGTALVIRGEAGDEVEEELKTGIKENAQGVITTTSGRLATGKIIHVLTGGQGAVTEKRLIESISEALRMAEELGSETLAIPGFFPEAAGLNREVCASAILKALRAHEAENVQKAILADPDEDTMKAWIDILEKMDEEE